VTESLVGRIPCLSCVSGSRCMRWTLYSGSLLWLFYSFDSLSVLAKEAWCAKSVRPGLISAPRGPARRGGGEVPCLAARRAPAPQCAPLLLHWLHASARWHSWLCQGGGMFPSGACSAPYKPIRVLIGHGRPKTTPIPPTTPQSIGNCPLKSSEKD
jgi:hypothetical protein